MKVSDKRKLKARLANDCAAVRRGAAVFRALDLPENAYTRQPCVHLCGDSRINIENHIGVLEVGETIIRLYTELGILRIEGMGLEIRGADGANVLIDGNIRALCYETRE
ncbi:MAG: YabP/YqfC family sporulation protein [Clostridia bacterium]|nr:YabP/YqfC family sporulation protein [Clostridia bacterium]